MYRKSDFPELNEYTDFILSIIEHRDDFWSDSLNVKINENHESCKSMFSTLVSENEALWKEIERLKNRIDVFEGKHKNEKEIIY